MTKIHSNLSLDFNRLYCVKAAYTPLFTVILITHSDVLSKIHPLLHDSNANKAPQISARPCFIDYC